MLLKLMKHILSNQLRGLELMYTVHVSIDGNVFVLQVEPNSLMFHLTC